MSRSELKLENISTAHVCAATPREAHNCEDGVLIKLAYRIEFQEKNERWRKRRDCGRVEEITAVDGGGRENRW